MTDYITDREIERLALGELDEPEANELMQRLEERGELERLEAIIADDEKFHEAHPPALLAAQVRAEVRRRTREHTTQEPQMINPTRTRFATGILAGFATATVLFAVIYVQTEPDDSARDRPERAAAMTTGGLTNQAGPARDPAPSEPLPETVEEQGKRGQVLVDRGTEFPMPSTFYMSKGEIIEAPARGITRIALSATAVIDATIHEQKALYIEAKKAGQSLLSLSRKNDGREDTRSTLVVVGEPLSDDVVTQLVEGNYVDPNYADGPPSLSECAAYSDEIVTLRIVAQHASTFIGHAHAAGDELSPELRRCIEDVAARWQVGYLVPTAPTPTPDAKPYSWPQKLSVGTVRFNFGTSAMCAPTDDDC